MTPSFEKRVAAFNTQPQPSDGKGYTFIFKLSIHPFFLPNHVILFGLQEWGWGWGDEEAAGNPALGDWFQAWVQDQRGHLSASGRDSKLQKFDLFPKTLLPSRAVTPQQAGGKPLSPDGESAPGTSSPEARPGSGSENGDGESFLSSPVSKGPKEGEESPGSISPLGSDSGSEAEKDEQDPSPAAGGRQRTPLDILTRVFPAHRRSVLELVLQGCGGDVVQAIEQILNNRGPDKAPDEGWAREGALQPSPAAAAAHHRPLLAGAMSPAIGTLGSRSAFSPLQPNASHFGAEASAYPLGTHLGLNPLRLAYSAHSRGLAFMAPYSTAGLMPTLGFRPPMDYAFSDLMRDRSAVHKEQVYSGGLYGPMVNNTPEKP
nr:doublesex- and mab-3-related transcription factor A2 [Pelodiscus sinensis]|eukprot:XP_006126511.2 doublesex- and mab-3-related transcription factor A2 [Pelodiscus sinensis]